MTTITERPKRRQTATKGETDTPTDEIATVDLPAAQERAVAALLASVTVEAAARKAGISDRTLHRWLLEPGFRRAFQAQRRLVMERAVGVLQMAALGAVEALVRNLKCGVPAVEIRAAQVILEQGMKGIETLEFEERLAIIEDSLDMSAAGPTIKLSHP